MLSTKTDFVAQCSENLGALWFNSLENSFLITGFLTDVASVITHGTQEKGGTAYGRCLCTRYSLHWGFPQQNSCKIFLIVDGSLSISSQPNSVYYVNLWAFFFHTEP